MNEPSPAAVEHFNRATEARSNKNFDLAISEFDACLSSSPNAEMTFFTLCYCWEVIFDKFDFFNRNGSSLTDYEVAWSLRAQGCLNKAIEIYELNYNEFTGDKVQMLKEYYLETRDRSNQWMPYGIMKYDVNGEEQVRDFEAVQQIKLPPLKGLESVLSKNEEKPSSEFDLEDLLRDDPVRFAKHLNGKALGLELTYVLNFDNTTDNEKINLLEKTFALYDQAIKLGLPPELTIKGYGSAGIALVQIASFKGELESSDWRLGSQNSSYAWRANQYLEQAFSLDSQSGGHVFGKTTPSNDSLPSPERLQLSDMLFYLDTLTSYQCYSLLEIQGNESVIPFVLEKLKNLAYLNFLPFPLSCIELAKSFHKQGDNESAIYWLNRIVTDVEDFADLDTHSSKTRRSTKERAKDRIATYISGTSENEDQNTNKSSNSVISSLAAVGTFIFCFLVAAMFSTSLKDGSIVFGGCCFPIIAAVIVYFVTPSIINSLRQR